MGASKRFGAKLAALQAEPGTYTGDPDHEEYAAYHATFDAANKTAEITELLKVVPAMHKLHQELVPEKVAYKDFWCRYFFQAGPMTSEEARKNKLLTTTELFDDEEFAWDEDESPHPVVEEPVAAAASPAAGTASAANTQAVAAAEGADDEEELCRNFQ